MIDVKRAGAYYCDGKFKSLGEIRSVFTDKEISEAFKGTMAYSVLSAHSAYGAYRGDNLNIRFDAIASHDITYVGIIQSAKASGLKRFPLPYVLTNCHNSLCAVGGTINEDDHVFGLSAAKKYGGVYVPANVAVIHSFMREKFAGCGKMILGSDSHTRYGAFGTMAIGEGGPELVKQLLGRTYDIKYPEVVAVELKGNVRHGVGPQDVALAIIGAVFKGGIVKNKVLEFVGDGIKNLDMEFRNGIDVMTTETTCLSSIWITDEKTQAYLKMYGRENDFTEMHPGKLAYYDDAITVDLSKVEPMIALPFHPSNVYKLKDVIENPYDILKKVENDCKAELNNDKLSFSLTDKIVDGKVRVSQGVIAGCAGGTYDNIALAANVLKGADQHPGIALKNSVGLYKAAHIPFILVGVGILAQSNILVPDIHGILYGVISDFSCLFHSVSFYKRGGICKKMPPLAVLLSVLQAKNDQPCDNKHHKTDADDNLSVHACLPPSFCGR